MRYDKVLNKFAKGALYGGLAALPIGSPSGTGFTSLLSGILHALTNWLKHRKDYF